MPINTEERLEIASQLSELNTHMKRVLAYIEDLEPRMRAVESRKAYLWGGLAMASFLLTVGLSVAALAR